MVTFTSDLTHVRIPAYLCIFHNKPFELERQANFLFLGCMPLFGQLQNSRRQSDTPTLSLNSSPSKTMRGNLLPQCPPDRKHQSQAEMGAWFSMFAQTQLHPQKKNRDHLPLGSGFGTEDRRPKKQKTDICLSDSPN